MGKRPLSDVNLCWVPKRVPPEDAAAYQALREAHCEQKHPSRDCSGRITLDRSGVTLTCPICGDARSLYPKEAPHG